MLFFYRFTGAFLFLLRQLSVWLYKLPFLPFHLSPIFFSPLSSDSSSLLYFGTMDTKLLILQACNRVIEWRPFHCPAKCLMYFLVCLVPCTLYSLSSGEGRQRDIFLIINSSVGKKKKKSFSVYIVILFKTFYPPCWGQEKMLWLSWPFIYVLIAKISKKSSYSIHSLKYVWTSCSKKNKLKMHYFKATPRKNYKTVKE